PPPHGALARRRSRAGGARADALGAPRRRRVRDRGPRAPPLGRQRRARRHPHPAFTGRARVVNTAHETRSLAEVHRTVALPAGGTWIGVLSAFAGPAYLVSVGYMDPGSWATDLAGGARFGYQLIWVLLMSNLIAVLLQTLSARLGVVTGKDLAQACRDFYPSWLSAPLWILCEIAIVACDLAEVLGAAIGMKLLFGIPLLWGVMITALDVLLLL